MGFIQRISLLPGFSALATLTLPAARRPREGQETWPQPWSLPPRCQEHCSPIVTTKKLSPDAAALFLEGPLPLAGNHGFRPIQQQILGLLSGDMQIKTRVKYHFP